MDIREPLIIHASGWGQRDIGWVNDFPGSLNVQYIILSLSKVGYWVTTIFVEYKVR